MEKETLNKIKETIEGYPVRNLYYKPIDNIIVGQVKCPVLGRETFLEGYVIVTWTVKGGVTKRFEELNGKRPDLHLKMPI